MAQTRRKRKRRHRGTQAGTIERSGRTSKPASSSSSSSKRGSSSASSKAASRQTAAERRQARFDNPPTWRGALNRAAFAAAILVVFVAVVQKNIAAGILLGAFAMVIYIPMSYYTDLALYRRRQRRKQSGER